ncbi:hypothetical protein OEB99_05195 [Actinotalea sp. M2MS4P-6]|uniref:alpha/beta hydrolase n=1 Tax=Actinotalea sp. M2MS4P-6 TaxID=2983762 RepID=UPI0021E4FDAC|nr:alpha/beta fold hydrolase [Actinotalea sp. M2MS4P-6]MCV2393698.1 hypothetical protein [Actinotalea sp. M2MS4P-6]
MATIVGGIGLAGCAGGNAGPPYEVTSDVISGEETQEIGVWAPDADGSWPVVIGIHGYGGVQSDWDVVATELAKQGVVVFVPEFRSTSTELDIKADLVCAMQYARSVAGDYGGDLDQPYTFVGHSLGALIALVSDADARSGTEGVLESCFEGNRDPDVVVAMEGTYYDTRGDDLTVMPATGTQVTLVAGENDETSPVWQSQDAADALRAAGYDVTLVTIPGGTHGTPLFLDPSQDPWAPLPTDDPAGQQVVQAIVDAIDSAR